MADAIRLKMTSLDWIPSPAIAGTITEFVRPSAIRGSIAIVLSVIPTFALAVLLGTTALWLLDHFLIDLDHEFPPNSQLVLYKYLLVAWGMVAGIAFAVITFVPVLLFAYSKRKLASKKLGDGQMILMQAGLRIEHELGSEIIPWQTVTNVMGPQSGLGRGPTIVINATRLLNLSKAMLPDGIAVEEVFKRIDEWRSV